MARGFNKVVLMGNLTRDPELRTTPNGQTVCSFSLAINRTWRNADGEQQEAVDFIDCNAWGKAAEIINQYMQKGRALLISGRLQHRTWEQDGQKRSKVEVVVEDFNFVGSGDGASSGATRASSSSSSNADSQKSKSSSKKDDDEVVIEDIDDEPVDLSDIPF
ncbi:MAG TPA: single-stranded DNA-binding protein [Candidatus Saccharimonadales bacterium]